jgi:ribosome maturation factor RimP
MQDDERTVRIEEVILPVLQDHGLELVDLEWRGDRPRGVLRVFVDKSGGVGIRDCERVSRELGDVLDASALISERYDLEVSSPGLDRMLRKEREFRWAVGRPVQCWLAGGEEIRGRLVAVSEDRLVLDSGTERRDVERARLTKARLEPEVPWPRRASSP